MSYKIKFDDITSVQVESQKTMNAWEESVASLNKAMTDFINNQNLQGQAISSMRSYLVEVHGTLLQTLVNLMNDYSTNLLLYKDGYYQIDSSNHAKLPGQVFTTLHSDLKSSRDNLKSEIELLNTTKDKISDLVSYSGSSHTSTVMNYNFLMNQVKNLDNSIIQYESNHASQDLVAFKELLSATKALIAEHAGKTRTVGTYQSGDFAKLKSVQRFAIAYQQASKQMESRVERVKAAQERDKVRFEALAAEDRAKNGWKDLAIGVVTVAIGALAIWATMGAATPLVVGAGLTAGIGTAAYGASNAGEGIHNIQLGNAGDAHTKSYNLIRDTLFMGNDKLYHDVGNVFVTASAIMIPIGQTQSVVKGLTQFAIGEAGAYTAGQVAYHGTKLLGGSEEDAQTANFIGNILGGYAVSSAASKFSLNKVKVEVEAPKYNREQILKNLKESKLARESSNFDQYLAKEKLQLGLNKSPLVSRELPRVKGVHDVEAPKYNREQILKNLEESKLARESSNFDQYLAKEKLQLGLNKSPLVSRELPRVKGTANPSPSQSTTRAIIGQKLKEYGVSWDEFNRLRNTHVTKMTQSEYDMMIDIRNAIPYPKNSTVMQKIMPIEDEVWIFNRKEKATAGGYVAKRSDVKNITNIREAVEGLRLDYEGSPFVETMIDANGNRVAVRDQNGNLKLKTDAYLRLEYTTDETGYIKIPYGDMDGNLIDAKGNVLMNSDTGKPYKAIDPASGNGFIKSDSDEFLVPEYRHSNRSRLKEGSKLYLNVGGEEVLVGRVNKYGIMEYVEG